MSEETLIIPARQQGQSAELNEAVEKFKKAFAERSFSERHEDLGKMINCHLCGRRHYEGDPLAKLSVGHGEQKKLVIEQPSIHNIHKPHRKMHQFAHVERAVPRHNPTIRDFVKLTEKIFHEDIEPYFRPDPEHPDNLIRRAQRQAAKILRKKYVAARLVLKHMQDHSRRINAGLEAPGSRYSHPVRNRKKAV